MSGVIFRPAAQADEPVLLRMMHNLAEQEPGAYFFDEPAVREVLRKFLASPDLGQAWVFYEDQTPVGYIVLTFGYSFEYHGRDSFIDERTSSRNIGGRELAGAPCSLWKSVPESWERTPSISTSIRVMTPLRNFIAGQATQINLVS